MKTGKLNRVFKDTRDYSIFNKRARLARNGGRKWGYSIANGLKKYFLPRVGFY